MKASLWNDWIICQWRPFPRPGIKFGIEYGSHINLFSIETFFRHFPVKLRWFSALWKWVWSNARRISTRTTDQPIILSSTLGTRRRIKLHIVSFISRITTTHIPKNHLELGQFLLLHAHGEQTDPLPGFQNMRGRYQPNDEDCYMNSCALGVCKNARWICWADRNSSCLSSGSFPQCAQLPQAPR